MKRMIMDDLVRWKDAPGRKPLLLTGVRQCGKTYILKRFGEEHFSDVAYLNLEKTPSIAAVFEQDLDPVRILSELSNVFLRSPIEPGRTLLILDEIQAVPKAITALKYFYEDLPTLHLIGAGSLLGVSLRRDAASFPVGKVERKQLYPMSFREESLDDKALSGELGAHYTEPLKKALLTYYVVGGMPEAVHTWVTTQDYQQVQQVQDNILFGYAGDFSKHAPPREFPNLEAIWQSIPVQLAEDNSKFVFSRVKKSARAKDLEAAIQWLVDAGLVHLLQKVEQAKSPLAIHADASFYKVYLCDVGLLCRKAGLSFAAVFDDSVGYQGFKGALTENFVLTELLSSGFSPYYWRSGNTAELDFLVESEGQVIPIEAKANLNTQAKSYREFVKRFKPRVGFKFSLKNIGENQVEDTKTHSLPLYLVYHMKRLIQAK